MQIIKQAARFKVTWRKLQKLFSLQLLFSTKAKSPNQFLKQN